MDEGFAEYRRYVKDALPDLSDLEIEEAWMQWPYSPVHVMKRAPG